MQNSSEPQSKTSQGRDTPATCIVAVTLSHVSNIDVLCLSVSHAATGFGPATSDIGLAETRTSINQNTL